MRWSMASIMRALRFCFFGAICCIAGIRLQLAWAWRVHGSFSLPLRCFFLIAWLARLCNLQRDLQRVGFLCVGRQGRSSFLDVCKLVANSEHMYRMGTICRRGRRGRYLYKYLIQSVGPASFSNTNQKSQILTTLRYMWKCEHFEP